MQSLTYKRKTLLIAWLITVLSTVLFHVFAEAGEARAAQSLEPRRPMIFIRPQPQAENPLIILERTGRLWPFPDLQEPAREQAKIDEARRTELINGFSDAAEDAANACRSIKGRGRTMIKRCGNRSKKQCYAAFKDACLAAGVCKERLGGGEAIDAHRDGVLADAGFVNIFDELKKEHGDDLIALAENAPAGTVLVYSSPPIWRSVRIRTAHGIRKRREKVVLGHIEFKTSDGKYCSDFCSEHPVSSRINRTLEAVYALP